MHETNDEKIMAEVRAKIMAELARAGVVMPVLEVASHPAPVKANDLDELEGLLSLRHTLERFASVVADHVAHGEMILLPQIVAFVATLTEAELLALSRLDDVEQVASLALAHLPIGQRAIVVRGLHAIADAVLDLALDVIVLADS